MARRNVLPARDASCSRCSSKSSKNLRNMIHVSSGNRSRSPFSPLSLRMMSRADLRRLPRDWAVVGAGVAEVFFALGGIEVLLEFGYRMAKLIGPPEHGDDVTDLPMGGKWGNLEYIGQHELRVTVDRVLLK